MPAALYFMHDPLAPQPNKPSRFGSAVVICCNGEILLEHRKDNFRWGVVSGDIKDTETFKDCAVRRTIEETGIHLKHNQLEDLGLFDNPSRIVSFFDGNIYRVVHLAYFVELDQKPKTVPSHQSIELKWVDPLELSDYDIVITHQEILEKYFKDNVIQHSMKRSFREQQ